MFDHPKDPAKKYPDDIVELGQEIILPKTLFMDTAGMKPLEKTPSITAPDYDSKIHEIARKSDPDELRNFCQEHNDVFGDEYSRIESATDRELKKAMNYIRDDEKFAEQGF